MVDLLMISALAKNHRWLKLQPPNELRIDAAEGSKVKAGLREPPHQSELD